MIATLALTLVALASTPETSETSETPAQQSTKLFRPSSHAYFATFQLGPAMEVAGDWGTQLKVGQDFGYHLDGSSSGLAIGVSAEESFGNCTDGQGVSCFSFQIGPKLWYDVQLASDLPIYISPSARLAFAHVSLSAGGFGGSFNGVGLQLGLEARVVLGDRAILFFRPLTLDLIAGDSDQNLARIYDDNVAMRYDLTFGGGVAF